MHQRLKMNSILSPLSIPATPSHVSGCIAECGGIAALWYFDGREEEMGGLIEKRRVTPSLGQVEYVV